MEARSGKLRAFCFLLPLLASLAAAAGWAQPAFQVKDLNTTRTSGILPRGHYFDAPDSIAAAGTGRVFFTASDETHGSELWRTDGTEAGTRLVADICPGSCESIPQSFMAIGELLFFLADDGLHGLDLWKSDGTPAGTALIKDARNDEDRRVQLLAEIQGSLLFSIGMELWRSDGTAEGTFLVVDLQPSSSAYLQPLGQLAGKLIFTVQNGYSLGTGIWTSDGTASGTVLLKDIVVLPDSPTGPRGAVAGGRMFFLGQGSTGTELWMSDGTESGTVQVPFKPSAGSRPPTELTGLGEEVFFLVPPDNWFGNSALWKSDGTAEGTVQIASIPFDSHSLTARGDRLFFLVDRVLWTSDGTEAGTTQLYYFAVDRCPIEPDLLTQDGEELWLAGCDWDHGYELWKSDGTLAGTSRIADVYPGVDSSMPGQVVLADGRLYFRAKGGEQIGRQLWTSDGTEVGTQMLRINDQASGFSLEQSGSLFGPRPFFDLDGTLLFTGNLGELWRSDGTAVGTFKVHDAGTGEFNRAGGTVFLSVGLGNWIESLWKTDGTPEGTLQVYSVDHWFSSVPSFGPRDLTVLGDDLLFIGPWTNQFSRALLKSDGTPEGTTRIAAAWPDPNNVDSVVSNGNLILFQEDSVQLWKSDGTEAGTTLLRSILVPYDRLLKDVSALRDGVLFFAGRTPESGEDLWRSDGTEAGTYLLSEIVPGPDSKRLGSFATAGPTVFFVAGGHELWKNDAAGTALVRSLPGDDFVGVSSLTALGTKVYFTYDDGEHGRELWVSDGTEAGTRMVEDILPGPGSSHPRELHAEGSILLFSATDGVHSVEPWRSNGTAVGTRMLQDIAPGSLPSSPVEFTASGPNIYFAATDGTTGFELWALPRPALLATFADVPASYWAWRFIEALAVNGITAGCSPDSYCPGLPMPRAEAAVFLLRAAHGPLYTPPPATGTRFEDVPASFWAGAWIEQLAAEGITAGCGPALFCPASPLSRAEMAVLLLRAKHGPSYVPPPAIGTRFEDVPADYWAAAWIEQLASEGITGGCAPNQFCPERAVTRAEMATLLATTFGLPLPPPAGGLN